MKIATNLIVVLVFLLSSQIFSQVNIRIDPEKYLQERIYSKPNLNKQVLGTSESDIIKDKESRTIISKTILDNGFLLIEQLYQDWDGSGWVDDGKYTYTYDANNNMIEKLMQDWLNSNWVNHWKSTYTYDMNNNMITQLEQSWNGSNWTNFWVFTYTYDGNNNMIESIRKKNDFGWVNDEKITNTYDVNNNMVESFEQEWDDSTWVNYKKHTYTYDVNNNMIEWLWQNWAGSNWMNIKKNTYTYDVNNNMIESLEQVWGGSNWDNDEKEINSYIPLTGVEQLTAGIKAYSLLNNYPNPFNPVTTIEYLIPDGGLVTLKIYDVLGNEVATLVYEEKPAGDYEVEFFATNLPSGIYFYRLRAGSFAETKKMLLLK